MMALLLNTKRVNCTIQENLPIRIASKHGHYGIVMLLLTDGKVNPADCDNESLISASNFGHIDIVKFLLKDNRVNPCANEFEAIKLALNNGHFDIVKLLLNDKRVKQMKGSHTLEEIYHKIVKISKEHEHATNIFSEEISYIRETKIRMKSKC